VATGPPRKIAREGVIPEHVRRAVLFFHADRCFYCGREADTVDHIIAGDGDDPTNLTAACTTCNAAKSGPTLLCGKPAPKHGFIAADVARLAEQYREILHGAKRRTREGSTPIG
jgi:5-methylcytosine-specific restriction endonuclease McrA